MRRTVEPGTRVTGAVAMLVDAWQELRVNRLRILLALVGITVAVMGLTGALGAGQIAIAAQTESSERDGGRAATVTVEYDGGGTDSEDATARDRLARMPDDFGVTHHTLRRHTSGVVWTPSAQIQVQLEAVEPAYGEMFRVALMEGRFLVDEDVDRLAPALVINEKLWTEIGEPDVGAGTSVEMVGADGSQTFTVVGVTPERSRYDSPHAWMLNSQSDRVPRTPEGALGRDSTQLIMWVPPDLGEPLAQQINTQMADQGMSAYRSDWAQATAQTFRILQWFVIAAAAGMFVLGALGLVNINLVTMQHRVREIGIRRSYGATSGRIFLGVLLESVVATFVAGVVGVVLTVLLVQNPVVHGLLERIGVYEPPPFPLSAALVGLAAATLVGALAGALPAIRATRVQIIDAIRY